MHLKRLRIKNFRALKDIEVDFDTLVSVIIGPNAIGKTTLLEAIRLNKAILSPRTQNEANQTLFSLGIMSPHMPQQLFPNAITNTPEIPMVIKSSYSITDPELATLQDRLPQLVINLAQQSVGINFGTPAQAMSFLNSPAGQAAIHNADQQLKRDLEQVRLQKTLNLNLSIDFSSGNISGEFQTQQLFASTLDSSLLPSRTKFSYFPADRAMPTGEQPVQFGLADTNAQLESYNSQPQIKYNRLKSTIFNTIIGSEEGRSEVQHNFGLIFDRILRGRAIGRIGVNQIGMLSIPIIDKETSNTFEIDGLSSGEKGLILTFLLIAQNVENDGLLLLDEPELHLNPAVSRDLLQFLVDEYASKRNIQALICSHSAEILAGAFERQACSLFHLKGGTALEKVRQKDQGEIRDALRRLGSSESEALLYKASVSVEGIHDVEILQIGFHDVFRRCRIKSRGGRTQVENDIRELQKAENKGDDIGSHYFIFDHDRKPTELRDTTHVRLLQLGRYCLENYLLDVEVIADVSREHGFSDNPFATPTEARDFMKRLALQQLNQVAARIVFKDLALEGVGFQMEALKREDGAAIAKDLWEQINAMAATFSAFTQVSFQEEFQRRFALKLGELQPTWEENWRELCDGKRLFEDARREGRLKGDLLRIKRQIMGVISSTKTEAWRSLESQLKALMQQ